MADSEQEQTDIETLKEQIKNRKLSAYDYMLHLTKLTPEQLKYTGHRAIPEALVHAMESAQKDIEKLFKAHLKKYPDC